MGKTTFVRKVAWDWAVCSFCQFSIIFVVSLKLVRPTDTIEDVIIRQHPPLEALNVSEQRLKQMFDKFGFRCLLVLDGLDEHMLGSNEDVLKIIEGRKLLKCNILLTSRPHSTRQHEGRFSSVISVDGFTRREAEKFALKLIRNRDIVEFVLNFKPANVHSDKFMFQCPILLSFMCLLVAEDKTIDLEKGSMETGEIYARMVECLYKKYTIRKGIPFEKADLVVILKSVGRLAWKTLLSGNPLMKRNDVIRAVGVDAFAFGLLIGNEDFRLISDPSADILITLPHTTIQEFLGAFFFVLMLSTGSEDILTGDAGNLLSNSAIFLDFCRWFIEHSMKRFGIGNNSVSKYSELVGWIVNTVGLVHTLASGVPAQPP